MSKWLKRLLLDVLVPLSALTGISIAVMGDGWTRMHSVVIGGGNPTTPSDVNGTLWFYWWVARAKALGQDILTPDVICAPTGQSLGSNFPQQIDALMAAPFISNLPTPAGFNTFVVLIPVLGAFAAYISSRWLGLGRLSAMMVGLLFGFNSLSIHELSNGKPPSALVFTIPLFIGAWIKCLTTRGKTTLGWVVLAGVTAALAIQHYVLYALLLALFAAATLVLFTVRPARGMARRRAIMAGLIVTVLGLSLSAPYLQRLLGERRPMPAASALRMSDPAVLREQAESIDVGYIFGVDEDEDTPRRAAFPVILTFAALILLPFGGRRHRRWLLAGFAFYLLSLGPMAATSVRPEVEWMTIAGRGVPLPTWWLNSLFPFSIQFFHPCRVFPMVVLCMAMAVACGIQHWAAKGSRRFAAPVLAIVIAVTGFYQVRAQGGMRVMTADWQPHAFFEELAQDDAPGALIEFPLGLGHATAPNQLIHGWKRSESHHDFIAALKDNNRPEDCLQLPIFDALWDMSRGLTATLPSETDIAQARRSGFRYLVVYRAGFDVLTQAGISIDRKQSIQRLRTALGPPTVNDETIVVFDLEGAL